MGRGGVVYETARRTGDRPGLVLGQAQGSRGVRQQREWPGLAVNGKSIWAAKILNGRVVTFIE